MSPAFTGLLVKLWPIFALLAVYVAGVLLFKYIVYRFKGMK